MAHTHLTCHLVNPRSPTPGSPLEPQLFADFLADLAITPCDWGTYLYVSVPWWPLQHLWLVPGWGPRHTPWATRSELGRALTRVFHSLRQEIMNVHYGNGEEWTDLRASTLRNWYLPDMVHFRPYYTGINQPLRKSIFLS